MPPTTTPDSFIIIENQDPGLRYSLGWNVVLPDPRERRVGMSWTQTENASVEVGFYGTSISIYGNLFEGSSKGTSSSSSSSTFTATVDGAAVDGVWSSSAPNDSGSVSQRLFTTPPFALSNHTLVLTMRSDGVPLYLDYFNITQEAISISGDPADASLGLPTQVATDIHGPSQTLSAILLPADTAASQSSIRTTGPHSALSFPFKPSHSSTPVGGIVGGVLGGAVFVAVGVLWVVLRRRKRRAEREDEDDLDRDFERVVPGWKSGEKRAKNVKGGAGMEGGRNKKTRGTSSRSKLSSYSHSHSRSGRRRPPKLQPITFARDPEDFDDDEWDEDVPTPVTRVMSLKHERYRNSDSLPQISPVSPFHEAELGVDRVGGDDGDGDGDGVPRVSVSSRRGRGGGADGEDDGSVQARAIGQVEGGVPVVEERSWVDGVVSVRLATATTTRQDEVGRDRGLDERTTASVDNN